MTRSFKFFGSVGATRTGSFGLEAEVKTTLSGKGTRMKRARHCYKGAGAMVVVALGALLCRPVRLAAQARSAPEASTWNMCDLPKDAGDGLAIISATLPPKERHVGFPEWFKYKYRPNNAGWPHGDKVIDITRRGAFHEVASDFDGVFGKLYVLRLPAGAYQFGDWEYGPLGMRGVERPYGIHPLTFTVEAGRAVYLGGFDPTLTEGKNLLHQKVDEAWVLVHDDQTRDLPVFLNKCHGFDRNQLDVKVMDTSPWLPPKKK